MSSAGTSASGLSGSVDGFAGDDALLLGSDVPLFWWCKFGSLSGEPVANDSRGSELSCWLLMESKASPILVKASSPSFTVEMA